MSETTLPTTKNHTPAGRFAQGNRAAVGHRPAGGRPSNEARALAVQIMDGEGGWDAVREILADPRHKDRAVMLRFLIEYGYGKAELAAPENPKPSSGIQIPEWDSTEKVQ